MTLAVEKEIGHLRSLFWSARDPEGRAFAPLADAYRRAGDYKKALELLNEGLDRLPAFAPGHVVAARLYLEKGLLEEAELASRQALDLDDENTVALEALAGSLQALGRLREATEVRERLELLEGTGEARATDTDRVESPLLGAESEIRGSAAVLAGDVVDVADLAPDAVEPAVDLDALAPDEVAADLVMDLGALVPEEVIAEKEGGAEGRLPDEVVPERVVDLDALAPDEAAGELVVDLGALAPEEIIAEEEGEAESGPRDEFAAERVVDLDALAPDEAAGELVVDLGALAPEEIIAEEEEEAEGQLPDEVVAERVVDLDALAPDQATEELMVDLDSLFPDEVASGPGIDLRALAPEGIGAEVEEDHLEAQSAEETAPEAGIDLDAPLPDEAAGEPAMDVDSLIPDQVAVEPTVDVDTLVPDETGERGDGLGGLAPEETGAGEAAEAEAVEDAPEPSKPVAAATAEERSSDELDDELEDEPLVTRTMAELYAQQGLVDRALEVFTQLLRAAPDDDELRERVRQLEAALDTPREQHPTAAPESMVGETEPEDHLWQSEPSDDAAGVDTPFAWTEDEAEDVTEGPRISSYFDRILSWRSERMDGGSDGQEET